MSNRITFEKSPFTRLSIGKIEQEDFDQQSQHTQIFYENRQEEGKKENETDIVKERKDDKGKERDSKRTMAARKIVNKYVLLFYSLKIVL